MNRNERERKKTLQTTCNFWGKAAATDAHLCALDTCRSPCVCTSVSVWCCALSCAGCLGNVPSWQKHRDVSVCLCVCVQQDAATSFRLVLYLWRWVSDAESLNAAACFFSSDLSSGRQEPLHLVFDLGAKWKPPGCTNTITSRPWCSDRKILC